jgi:flagellar M-ring protein FliF
VEDVLQQLLSVWSALDMRRRIVVVGATLAMFAAVLALGRMASAPSLELLYSGLDGGAAGEVVAALEARGVPYEVRGASIFVDGAQRDELRMTLAAEGLPANGGQGYELLDSLSGFGTTSQMFDAAYWRAKEGELARTIVASPGIKAARVHIATAGSTPFRRQTAPTASVTVTTAGGQLDPARAKALKYLVASAVAGMDPEMVSIIDANGGLVLGTDEAQTIGGGDRAEALRQNVARLLEARVGRGNAVVEVNVDTVTDREQITERRFDPESRVAISQETEESTSQSTDSRGGEVTVASNLPDGDAAQNEGQSSSQNSETRSRTNFEVSETQREILRGPGAIKRVTVAVLVDGIRTTAADGTTEWQPRPEAEMEALRELVASAVGYDADRGDTITLKSMEFSPIETQGTAAAAASLADRLALDAMSLAQLVVLGIVALILGLFVVRPILSGRGIERQETPALAAPSGAAATPADLSGGPALDGEIDDDVEFPAPMLSDMGAAPSGDPNSEAVSRLRQLIEERREETVGVLRSWMEDSGGRA